MDCPGCGSPNAAEAKFCSACGHAQVASCPSCGAPNAADARFCNMCGTSLVPAQSPVQDPGERRLVTALFADLVGFTPFTAAHDAEEVRAMLVNWFDAAREVVEGFGGLIDKYTGDAITAFWGARVAREDDAERAVRSGLRLVDAAAELGNRLGIEDLRLRVGIATGETSVGQGGNATGLVVGDLVNVAARLQPLAEPGTVLVAESTQALAPGIEFQSVGSKQLKGVVGEMPTFRAVRIAGRRLPGDLEPPFVGRPAELHLIEDQYAAAVSESRARLVSIVGDAGIGKTRLADEARDRVGLPARWYRGRSSAWGDGMTFEALSEVVRQIAGIDEATDRDHAFELLSVAVSSVCPDVEEQRWIVPRLAGVLHLDQTPAGDRHDLFGAARTFLQRVAGQSPLVLVFDELQWADESMLDFVADLVERSRTVPILVLALARPELSDRHPEWGAARHRSTIVHLGPISDRDMTSLVAGMVPGIEQDTVGLIVGAAGGVPLYAVEYARMIVESGALVREGDEFRQTRPLDSLGLPESLQAVIGARLDRLPAPERTLVTEAAVLGDTFSLSHLQHATGESLEHLLAILENLARLGIFEVDENPRATAVRFVQSTVREMAYRRLAKEERARRHLQLVERFGAGDTPEDPGVIANHAIAALEARPDTEIAQVARHALLAAAKRASSLHAARQALRLVERAIAIPGSDADRVSFWEVGAEAAGAAGDHPLAEDLARRALDWWRQHGEQRDATSALTRLGRVLLLGDHPSRAVTELALDYDPELAHEPTMAWLGLTLAACHRAGGGAMEAADLAAEVMVAAAGLRDQELMLTLLRERGLALHRLDRSHEAVALVREAVRLAAGLDAPSVEARSLTALIWMEGRNGRRRDVALPERLLHLARRAGDSSLERQAMAWTGRILTAVGDYRAARVNYETHDWIGPRADERYDRSRIRYLDWITSGDPSALKEAEKLIGDREEPNTEGSAVALSAHSQYAYARGDAATAFGLAMTVDVAQAVPHSFLFDIPIFAAFRLADSERLRQARDRLPAMGDRFSSLADVANAGLDLMEDGSEESVTHFVDVAERHAMVDGPGDTAQLHAIAAILVPESPTARRAGDEARHWFLDHDAVGFLNLYAEAWGDQTTA